MHPRITQIGIEVEEKERIPQSIKAELKIQSCYLRNLRILTMRVPRQQVESVQRSGPWP
jgi:hypothetical protein